MLGYRRGSVEDGLLVLANFSEQPQRVAAHVLSGLPAQAQDLVSARGLALDQDLTLQPYQQLWLRLQA